MITSSGQELALPADPQRHGELIALGGGLTEALAAVDVVFPVLHGPYGEDGTIQGLLELAGIPYVGAGVLASAAGMDKEFAKKLLAAGGLPIGDYVVLRPRQASLTEQDKQRLSLPVFVKPARAGSSIGVNRVSSWEELPAAIADARRHDPKVLVEKAIRGRELECGVLELPDGTVEASTVGEIRVEGVRGREDSFYDFATKYLDDGAELDVPAKIDDHVADEVRALAIRAFHAIDCQGLARVDFFLTEDGPVVNEINTMPGFTTISMYPADVGGQRRGLSDAARGNGRHRAGQGRRAALNRNLARRAWPDRHRGQLRGDDVRHLLNRSGPGVLRQGQRDVHRPVDDEPGAAAGALLGHAEPLDTVDNIHLRPDNEIGGLADPTAQQDRLACAAGPPRGSTRWHRVGGDGPLVVAEPLRQHAHQGRALGGVRLRDRHRRNHECLLRRRPRLLDRDNQHGHRGRHRDTDRGDQQGSRWAVVQGWALPATGHVRVRVMLMVCCTLGTTSACSCSTVSAVMRAITS